MFEVFDGNTYQMRKIVDDQKDMGQRLSRQFTFGDMLMDQKGGMTQKSIGYDDRRTMLPGTK